MNQTEIKVAGKNARRVKGATAKAALAGNLNPVNQEQLRYCYTVTISCNSVNPYPFSRIRLKVFMKHYQLTVCQMDGIIAQ